jgi:hypothetical protein
MYKLLIIQMELESSLRIGLKSCKLTGLVNTFNSFIGVQVPNEC